VHVDCAKRIQRQRVVGKTHLRSVLFGNCSLSGRAAATFRFDFRSALPGEMKTEMGENTG